MHILGADPHAFPEPEATNEDGIIALGGDLSPQRLIEAYRRGIFPWYSEGLPILWHCPDPRFVLESARLHVSRSLEKELRRTPWEIRLDTNFDAVVLACASTPRKGQRGTWITRAMRAAYRRLFDLGIAHSVEVYRDAELIGGLYGVSIGNVFFGESMFSLESNASKLAFVQLVRWMRSFGVALVDCQQETSYLASFGAESWNRERFLRELAPLVHAQTHIGPWRFGETPPLSALP